jgi:2-polyprenyl-3-methyl-5-hydroxy-6-metoxy-1,4-benzoquinol methylase
MYIHYTSVHNTNAAEQVVPLIIETLSPKSVLDVGCGIGTWLNIFKKNGVEKIKGIDGSYVDMNLLLQNISNSEFEAIDLSKPFELGEKYDLVVCLEVAEHLHEDSTEQFIISLTKHSNTILFSAAVPNQGGQNHLNEQWAEYWINIFEKNGYFVYDLFRAKIWDNSNVEWWYKQNILVFSRIRFENYSPVTKVFSLIHPDHFNDKVLYIKKLEEINHDLSKEVERLKILNQGIKIIFYSLLKSVKNFITNRSK